MKNLALFNQFAGQALADLYAAFPVRRPLLAQAMTGHHDLDEFGAIIAPDGRPSKEAEVALSTLQWLAAAGLIDCERQNPPFGLVGCVLTAKGLELLNALPESVLAKNPMGRRLVDAVRVGAAATVESVMAEVVRKVAAWL